MTTNVIKDDVAELHASCVNEIGMRIGDFRQQYRQKLEMKLGMNFPSHLRKYPGFAIVKNKLLSPHKKSFITSLFN